MVELSQPTSSRGRLGQYTGYVGAVRFTGSEPVKSQMLIETVCVHARASVRVHVSVLIWSWKV